VTTHKTTLKKETRVWRKKVRSLYEDQGDVTMTSEVEREISGVEQ
jgi:hypothetical protein